MAFEPIGNDYIGRNFNDRRIGGKPYGQVSRNRSPYEGHWPDKGGLGGTRLPRKPKSPKTPMPANAVSMKHNVKGY